MKKYQVTHATKKQLNNQRKQGYIDATKYIRKYAKAMKVLGQ